MNNGLLKEAIADAQAVRKQALENAKQALQQAFASNLGTGFICHTFDDGSIRYTINTPEGVDNAYDDIEKKGYIILDEDEDANWIDAINPKTMESNLNAEDMMSQMTAEISKEIDKQILDILVKEADDKKLKNKYYKFRSWMKGSPCSVDESAIPTFEQWKDGPVC